MRCIVIWALSILTCGSAGRAAEPWVESLKSDIEEIDRTTSGVMGVFIKDLEDATELNYHADRKWYLASTVKVPVAIALLQKQEQEGKGLLDRKIVLQSEDYVDGAGDLLMREPGTEVAVGELLEKMLVQSDSTAADILIRLLGERDLNEQIRRKMEDPGKSGFGRITTLLQVRYDAYGELHPWVARLSNLDFVELKKFKDLSMRLDALLAKLGLKRSQLKFPSIEDAFEQYYKRGWNSASLVAFGAILEKLVQGKLLRPGNTDFILDLMAKMVTGEKRIKGGLPPELRFAQKTGTQVRRACNVGVLRREEGVGSNKAIVIAACLEKFDSIEQAEAALQRLGSAISRSSLMRARAFPKGVNPAFDKQAIAHTPPVR